MLAISGERHTTVGKHSILYFTVNFCFKSFEATFGEVELNISLSSSLCDVNCWYNRLGVAFSIRAFLVSRIQPF